MVLIQREITTPFDEISPKELNKCPQKFYFSTSKRDDRWSLRAIIVIVGNSKCQLQITIFVLHYLTVLVYTKTTIHLSVGG